jgi:hypothetical protein
MKMIIENLVQSVSEFLFAEEGMEVYAVLDGASVPDLLQKLDDYQPECESLFTGNLEPDMAEVAPYLVKLEPDAEFTNWIIESGWGNHWGIFAVSSANFREMRQHFRSYLIVYDSDLKPLRFRYYDPRVLRLYLPTCNGEELKTVFGPVDSFMLEGEQPNELLCFKFVTGSLVQEKIKF